MKAAEFAAGKHSKQRRKGEEAEPYVNHLIEVARLVAEATDGRADMVVAALLHDTIEDQAVKFDEIVALFGSRVSSLVAEVTDGKSLPKQERNSAPLKSPDAAVITLADKISNLLALAKSQPPWLIERKIEYVNWAKAVISGLSFKPPTLLARFEEAAALATNTIETEEKTRSLETSRAAKENDSIEPA
jgi:hypothetical protein